MAVSSDPPAVGAPMNERLSAAQDDSGTTAQEAALKTTNAAPLAGHAKGSPAIGKPSQTSDQSTEKKTEGQAAHDDGRGVNPLDFHGAVETDNDLPSIETLRKIENYVVLDRDGKTHPFKSLYTGKHVARRVLIIFVRHFFCGNCQEYLRTLSAAITPESLLGLPISTFIAVVGCGDPGLIDMYAEATGCSFPVYADPTRKLYSELGMVKTLALGDRPAYMKKSLFKSSIASIFQGLKQIPKGLATKAGDQRQIGGEFLFEPLSVFTPFSSPLTEGNGDEKRLGEDTYASGNIGTASDPSPNRIAGGSEGSLDGLPGLDAASASATDSDPKRATWCHRMKTTRDHAEIPELMEVLGLGPDGGTKESGKRWSRALEMRKGTGLSMASQMSTMKA
ncbi:hypothetical protein CONLIGDRAFT_605633, partial [Coniochaeta ligniaria NRRL 30616]